jgi:hypothetical protein
VHGYAALAAALALPLSQLGHLLAYLLRYGPAGLARESFGAHTYFPSVAGTSVGLLGLLVLAAVAVVGLARLVESRRSPGRQRSPRLALAELVAVLLPLQLAIFTAQETAELALAGHLNGLGDLPLLWGLAGQVPVACLGALFLRWASVAVEDAIGRLHFWLDLAVAPAPLLARPAVAPLPVLGPLSADGRMAGRKRGPPRSPHGP